MIEAVTAHDTLDLMAAVSATLLGFVAVFLALTNREDRFDPSDRHFVQAFVTTSVLAIVLAISPRILSLHFCSEVVWPVAIAIAMGFGSGLAWLEARAQRRMTPEEAAQIHPMWHFGAWGLAAVSGVFFVSGFVLNESAAEFYTTGVGFVVSICLFVFVGLVFRRFF